MAAADLGGHGRRGGKTLRIDSAQPHYGANGLPAGGVKVEAVYVGLGSEADFARRDVSGKAVFVFNQTGLRNEGAVRRADAKGAAVIFEVDMLPGNMRYQAYPSGTKARRSNWAATTDTPCAN